MAFQRHVTPWVLITVRCSSSRPLLSQGVLRIPRDDNHVQPRFLHLRVRLTSNERFYEGSKYRSPSLSRTVKIIGVDTSYGIVSLVDRTKP